MKQFSPSYPLIFFIHFDTSGDTSGVIWPQKEAHQSPASGSEPRFLHGQKQSGLKTKHLKGCSRLHLSVYTLGCQDPIQSWNQLPHRVTGWLWYSMERSQYNWGGISEKTKMHHCKWMISVHEAVKGGPRVVRRHVAWLLVTMDLIWFSTWICAWT